MIVLDFCCYCDGIYVVSLYTLLNLPFHVSALLLVVMSQTCECVRVYIYVMLFIIQRNALFLLCECVSVISVVILVFMGCGVY